MTALLEVRGIKVLVIPLPGRVSSLQGGGLLQQPLAEIERG
jgi:hypothetical protein